TWPGLRGTDHGCRDLTQGEGLAGRRIRADHRLHAAPDRVAAVAVVEERHEHRRPQLHTEALELEQLLLHPERWRALAVPAGAAQLGGDLPDRHRGRRRTVRV